MSVTNGEEEKEKRNPRKDWKSIIYILVVKMAIANTNSDYNSLSEQTKNARMQGGDLKY